MFLLNLGGVQLLGHPWPHADGMNPQGSVSFGMPTVSDVMKQILECDVPSPLSVESGQRIQEDGSVSHAVLYA